MRERGGEAEKRRGGGQLRSPPSSLSLSASLSSPQSTPPPPRRRAALSPVASLPSATLCRVCSLSSHHHDRCIVSPRILLSTTSPAPAGVLLPPGDFAPALLPCGLIIAAFCPPASLLSCTLPSTLSLSLSLSLSFPMSAGTPRHQVYLPPSGLADFVIHYRDTDFHTHQFVLHHHSVYFRNYLKALSPLQTECLQPEVAGEKRKRSRSSAELQVPEERRDKCSHSLFVRCIDLPADFGDSSKPSNEDVFLLFLHHLYFSSTLHCPPFLPKPRLLDALTDSTPTSLTFPNAPATKAELFLYNVHTEQGATRWEGALLSLFHYFHCEEALKRSEATIVGADRDTSSASASWHWSWLPVAVRYSLKRVEEVCIQGAVQDTQVWLNDEMYRARMRLITPATPSSQCFLSRRASTSDATGTMSCLIQTSHSLRRSPRWMAAVPIDSREH